MKNFVKITMAAVISLGIAGSVLTSTTMQAAAWSGSQDRGGENTWSATDESPTGPMK